MRILLLILLIPFSLYAQWVYNTVLIQPKAPIIDGDLSDWEGLDAKAQPMEEFGLYWHHDLVEIYLDGDLTPPAQKEVSDPNLIPWEYDVNDAQIRISKDKAGNIVMDGTSLFNQRLVQLPGLWESLGVVAAIKENPSGYTVEVKTSRSTPY